jgi:hypothetical protein
MICLWNKEQEGKDQRRGITRTAREIAFYQSLASKYCCGVLGIVVYGQRHGGQSGNSLPVDRHSIVWTQYDYSEYCTWSL